MKLKTFIICLTLLLTFAERGYAQQMTTMGTDFWVTNIPYAISELHITGDSDSYSELIIIAVAPRECSVTVSNPNSGWDTSFNITPIQTLKYSLGYDSRPWQSEYLHGFGFHITATDSIALFAICKNGSINDKTLVLPKRALGNEYIIQTYYSKMGCDISVISTEDSTIVHIVPSCRTRSGRPANTPYSVLIPRAGQCLQLLSADSTDFSGTRVWSDDNKPIAVFQGNHRVRISQPNTPTYYGEPSILYEQTTPLKYWGRHFLVPHSSLQMSDHIRILAADSNCTVSINGISMANLNAGQSFNYSTYDLNSTDYIEADKRICIGLFPSSRWVLDTCILSSMVNITPLEHSTSNCLFHTSVNYASDNFHNVWLHITSKTADTSAITLNGNQIGQYFTPIISKPLYSHAKIEIGGNERFHLYSNSNNGFNAYVTFQNFHSAAFTVGAGLYDMHNMLNIRETINANLMDTINVCSGAEVAMNVESLYGNDSVRWYFGDGTTATGDTVWHTYQRYGDYRLTAIAYAECDTCYNAIDSLQTIIRVYNSDTTYADTTICGNSYVWQDSTYENGSYISRIYQNQHGCDSTVLLQLIFERPTSSIADTLYGCDSLLHNNIWYFRDTTAAFDTLTGTNHCDSILLHAIAINRSYERTQEIIIPDTATLTWIDGNTYSESTDSPYVVLQAANGCDSTIHLHLTVLPTPTPPLIDSTAVWVPNTFTPGEDINNCFRILCNDIITAEVSVFNRWGLHICTFDGLTDSWDGTYKGAPCPQGAYVYLITYTTVSQPSHPQRVKGTVLLLR